MLLHAEKYVLIYIYLFFYRIPLSDNWFKVFETAKEVLQNNGHEIVEINFDPSLLDFIFNGLNIMLNEAMPLVLEEMGNSWDSLDSNIQIFLFMYNYLPKVIIKSLSFLAKITAPRHVSGILNVWYPRDVDELAEMLKDRFNQIQAFTLKYHSLNLDGLIAPGFSDEAFTFEEEANYDFSSCFQFLLFSILHYPTGTI